MARDVILIHPPSIYDFRKRPIFPGPIAYTVGESTEQFVIPPIGMLSIADYLDRHGYRVVLDNIGERMLADKAFDVEGYIAGTSAKVYGIDLHWCVHAQGAMEIAKICKRLHPESRVVLGGLTSTVFDKEIIAKYPFVDAVIRGEAEKPFLQFMHNLENHETLTPSPSMTYRGDGGSVKQEPLMRPEETIDEFEFTRLDLLEPKGAVNMGKIPPHWSLPVCRGCVYNCATCGGSAYSYRTYLGRDRPGFRSPEKIAEDVQKLTEQGIRLVFLFQDPRMGGRKYREELVKKLRSERPQLDSLTMELFQPADQEYIKELASIGVHITLTISPESGDEGVRSLHGRSYTNEALLRTIDSCRKYGVNLMAFFMASLANESRATTEETWRLWERIYSVAEEGTGDPDMIAAIHSFGPMVLLDPGSLAFDFPEEHGYRLISKTVEDYIGAMSRPSWHQWLSYETKEMDGASITNLILDSFERSVELYERHGVYSRPSAARERARLVDANRWIIEQVDRAMQEPSEEKKTAALQSLKKTLGEYGA